MKLYSTDLITLYLRVIRGRGVHPVDGPHSGLRPVDAAADEAVPHVPVRPLQAVRGEDVMGRAVEIVPVQPSDAAAPVVLPIGVVGVAGVGAGLIVGAVSPGT